VDKVEDFHVDKLRQSRLAEFLELQAQQGLTQQEVAARARVNPQYLSDLKHGRRPMTELVARRLGEEFQIHRDWFLGTSSRMDPGVPRPGAAGPGGAAVLVPLFPHPIEGEPRAHPEWDGTSIEVAGAAAARLTLARWPYVVRFDRDDVERRLRAGDLVLVTQEPEDQAEIAVVKYRKRLFLARRSPPHWVRIANGDKLPKCVVCGHCLGIVWSALKAGV
jgi:plasmid maintenance system antidote protein VapI